MSELGVLDQDQFLVVVAEGVIGLQLELELVADLLAVQRLFQLRKNAVIAAVQIHQRVLAVVDDRAFGVTHGVLQRDDAIFDNFVLHSGVPVP